MSLFMSAYWKIPLQALVLLIGVFMFVFYLFTPPPMLFNRVHDERVRRERARRRVRGARAALQRGHRRAPRRPRSNSLMPSGAGDAAAVDARDAGVPRVGAASARTCGRRPWRWCKDVSGDSTYNDVNFVFPTFSSRSCRSAWSA